MQIRISRPYIEPDEQLLVEITEVLSSGFLTNGKYVKRLEDHIRKYIKVKHVIAVSSATSGLIILFTYLRKHHDWKKVQVPSFTFKSTIYAMRWANIEPRFVDIDDSWTVSPMGIKPSLPLIGVHTFGNPIDFDELPKTNIVCDAAHALGAHYKDKPIGSFGMAEVFSLAPTKVITSGEGGLICTNDDDLAAYARDMRYYGNREVGHGLNARMSEVHAILGYYSTLSFTKNWKKRHELVGMYKDLLEKKDNLLGFQRMNSDRSSYNYFGILINNRDEVYDRLMHNGIECKKYFEPQSHGHIMTDSIAKQIIVLPLHWYITGNNVYEICDLIR